MRARVCARLLKALLANEKVWFYNGDGAFASLSLSLSCNRNGFEDAFESPLCISRRVFPSAFSRPVQFVADYKHTHTHTHTHTHGLPLALFIASIREPLLFALFIEAPRSAPLRSLHSKNPKGDSYCGPASARLCFSMHAYWYVCVLVQLHACYTYVSANIRRYV